MGNYLTIIGSVRALWLLVALPFLIKLLKPAHPSELKEAHVSFAGSPTVAASPDTGTQPSVPGQSTSVAVPTAISQTPSSALVADLSFDIRLARLSYFIDAISYILVTIVAGASSEVFVMATLLSVSYMLSAMEGLAPDSVIHRLSEGVQYPQLRAYHSVFSQTLERMPERCWELCPWLRRSLRP